MITDKPSEQAPAKDTNLNAALDLSGVGMHVFPVRYITPDGRCSCGNPDCQSPGKHPMYTGWRHSSTTETASIRNWWTSNPRANIGIDTEKSGLVVFDLDNMATYDQLAREHPEVLETVRQRTGRGGAHLLYKARDLVVKSDSKSIPELPDVDIKAAGGYIVAAPSRNAKGPYAWDSGHGPGDIEIMPLPSYPEDLLRKNGFIRDISSKPAPVAAGPVDDKAIEKSAEEYTKRACTEAHVGNRNETGFKLACQLRDLTLSERQAERYMRDYQRSVTSGSKPYTEAQAMATLRSAYARTPREPAVFKANDPSPRREVVDQAITIKEDIPCKTQDKPANAVQQPEAPIAPAQQPPEAPPVDEALIGPVGYHLTDLGNSKRLVHDHHQDLLYCNQWRKWQVWDGQRWRQDDTGEIKRRAISTVASMFDDLKLIPGRDEREKYFKFIMRCESEAKIGSMIRLAESDVRVSVTQDRFDQDAYKLNFKNGTLDLKTMEFYPHRREDNITKMCNVEYIPEASCDHWKACLATWLDGNAEDIKFVQKALGYSLTGSTGEHVFFILYGTGRNGKSTFLDIVRHILNDYATSTPVESILQKRGAGIPNDIARLAGARFVTTVESDEGRKLAESLIKLLTGGDIVTARFLYGEFFDYQPQFKLWVATNHRPEIKGTDPAIWARVRLIPFNKMIPEDKRDKDLGAKLRAEASGIVNWMLEGYRLWQSEGHLKPSATVTAATTDYKNQMDDLGSFLADRCELGPESVYNKNLYAAYVTWNEDEGLKPLSNKAFTLRMKERGFTNKHEKSGKIWFGLSLLDEPKLSKGDGLVTG